MRRFSKEWTDHNLRHFGRRADWVFRLATASRRVLPDFLIIGTMKGGTTSLYDYLCQHPSVVSAYRKEVHFFDMHYTRGTRWYRANFPTHGELSMHGRGAVTGEATPYYLFHPAGPTRLSRLLPEAKLIAVLRNPVDRAVSHYFHSVRTGMESRPIEHALRYDQPILKSESAKLMVDGYESDKHRMWSYIARGHYADQLEAYLQVYPREQLLVLRSEDLFSVPQSAVDQTTRFLGLEDMRLHHKEVRNEGTYSKSDDPLSAPLRQQLTDYFRPHNTRLSELLGQDFVW